MDNVCEIGCFILDLDGTVYLGNEVIAGAIDFLKTLEESKRDFIFLTNNSSSSKSYYKDKLKRFGYDVDEDKIFTSGEATTIYLNSIKPKCKVFLLGTPYLEVEFIKAGFKVCKKYEKDISFVVVGFDTTLTYNKLWIACDLIREGVGYIATHPDINCPLEGGKYKPDAGAIINFIYSSTGRKPYIIGKPNPEIIKSICKKYNFKREDMAMVGDRLYTDIQTGVNSNINSILVLSGETTIEDYNSSTVKADFVYKSLKELNYDLRGGI